MTEAAIENFLQALTAGLLVGSIYGLMCVGLALIFGIMRVINFAQGEFLMLGMYVTLYLLGMLGLAALFGPALGPLAAAILAGPILFAFGYFVHRTLVSRVTGVHAVGAEAEGHYPQLILTLGIALIISNGGLILFGSTPQSVRNPLSASAWQIALPFSDFAMVFVNKARGVGALISIAVTAVLAWFISRSRLGKSLRAAADNPQAAIYMGIDVDRAHRYAFAIGSGVTGIAGGLVANYYPFQPYVGLEFVIIMYAGVVLGGMGSLAGAFWGGLTIGLVQQLSSLVMSVQLQNFAIFIVFLLVILLRPQGLYGRSAERT